MKGPFTRRIFFLDLCCCSMWTANMISWEFVCQRRSFWVVFLNGFFWFILFCCRWLKQVQRSHHPAQRAPRHHYQNQRPSPAPHIKLNLKVRSVTQFRECPVTITRTTSPLHQAKSKGKICHPVQRVPRHHYQNQRPSPAPHIKLNLKVRSVTQFRECPVTITRTTSPLHQAKSKGKICHPVQRVPRHHYQN